MSYAIIDGESANILWCGDTLDEGMEELIEWGDGEVALIEFNEAGMPDRVWQLLDGEPQLMPAVNESSPAE